MRIEALARKSLSCSAALSLGQDLNQGSLAQPPGIPAKEGTESLGDS